MTASRRPRPLDILFGVIATLVTGWVLIAPFTVVKYPPMNDLPMLASITSIFRHWSDPAWHFREQFDFQLLHVPTVTNFAIGAFFALFVPITWAVKLSSVVLMALLPIGLAVYCRGMKKSALGGVAAAGLAWGSLTQWGFLSYVGALGLMLMALGVTLLLLDRPTRGLTVALGALAALVIFTHVSLFPFVCLAVGLTCLCMLPAVGLSGLKPVIVAFTPAVSMFIVWWFSRPSALTAPVEGGWHFDRAKDIGKYVFDFGGEEAPALSYRLGLMLLGIALYSLVVNAVTAWRAGVRRPQLSLRQTCALAGALLVTLVFAGLYFWMPMKIGTWWYVHPRYMSAAVLCGLVLLPNLPANPWLRAPALGALLVLIILPMQHVSKRYAEFDAGTQDFQRLTAQLPLAPKLGYMVWDTKDYSSHVRPLLHLPAWVQAEKGGWISFHFANLSQSPVRYRTEEPRDVPPETPERFEWHPEQFDLATRGKYFDWFLVHSHDSREEKFAVDSTLHLVDHQGTWWLYKRG